MGSKLRPSPGDTCQNSFYQTTFKRKVASDVADLPIKLWLIPGLTAMQDGRCPVQYAFSRQPGGGPQAPAHLPRCPCHLLISIIDVDHT